MIERLYIKEILNLLPYSDRRSVIKLLRNKGVLILCDAGSNRQFVIKSEFEKAMNKNCFTQYHNTRTEKLNIYKPQGEYEKEFLSILQNINTTL